MEKSKDLKLALKAAVQAGKAAMKLYKSKYKIELKGDDNPVTQADMECNQVIKNIILNERGNDGWLSEETKDNKKRLEKERVWIVDPIDGTKDFIKGTDNFAISVGLVKNGKPVLGVVYNPAREELTYGEIGLGAENNGNKIVTSRRFLLKRSTILASEAEVSRGEFSFFEEDFNVKPIGSIAYKLALIARGKGDITFSLGPKSEWDICAGVAIVLAAGGRAGYRDGREIVFNRKDVLTNGIIGSTSELYEPVVRMCEQWKIINNERQ